MDTAIINAKIHTMDKSQPIAEAVGIENGRFVVVGSNEEVLAQAKGNIEVFDLMGRLLLPGFNDSHMHLFGFGNSLQMLNLSGTKSIEDIVIKAENFIKEKDIKEGKWVKGRGWNHDYFIGDNRFPNRYDLDRISTRHPIVLTRACGHVCVVNSKALELAGIKRDSEQVEGGHFDRDEAGEPLGIFRENALNLIYNIIPKPDINEIKAIIKEAASYANSKGLTSVQTDDLEQLPGESYKTMIKAYKELHESGELTLRIYEQCLLSRLTVLEDFIEQGFYTGYGDECFKLGPLKLLSDGSLGARTAALCEPYADDTSNKGITTYTQEELDRLVETAHNAGMQLAIHCIGDRAMYMAFDSIEKALRNNYREDHRHSIVHCQITDELLLEKFNELQVIAHIQPIFLHYDLHIVEDRIGREKAAKTYAFKTMINSGVHIGLGTDCPVEALDTMPNIYCAVTRKDLNGYPQGGFNPQERLTVEEAVYNYTMGGAYASFEDNIKGSITVGKLADMVVLSEDIFEIQPEKILEVEVDMTFLGGRLVFNRNKSGSY